MNSATAWPAEPEAVHGREGGTGGARAAARAATLDLRILEGDVVDRLVELAQDADVAAVVLGARGRPEGRRPAGHVALQVASRSSRPVVVVPPGSTVERLRRALVPMEASLSGAEAVSEVIRELCAASCDVLILHVYDERSTPAFEDQPQHELEAFSQEFLRRYCPRPERARLEVRSGSVADQILALAAEARADLIALSWGQRLEPERALVVRRVLAESPVPVLLAPV